MQDDREPQDPRTTDALAVVAWLSKLPPGYAIDIRVIAAEPPKDRTYVIRILGENDRVISEQTYWEPDVRDMAHRGIERVTGRRKGA